MRAYIFPSSIQGVLTVPPSKSVMQRICALALMNKGTTIISNYGNSDDELVALDVIKQCGALVTIDGNSLIIDSTGDIRPTAEISFGESGLSSRLFTPLLATTSNTIQLNAKGSLLKRSMHPLITCLTQNGVTVHHHDGHFPMTIQGPMKLVSLKLDGSSSSQYVTGFIYAISYQAERPVSLQLNSPVSKPYIELSIDWLKHFGYSIEKNENLTQIFISPRLNVERNWHFTVESDWSSAAFLIVAALIAGDLQLQGLSITSKQADKQILVVLNSIGADFNYEEGLLLVKKMDNLIAFNFDATDCPDLFPSLAVLAAYANGVSVIKGVSRLSNKESDRGVVIKQELGKLGVVIVVVGDEMQIYGTGVLNGGIVHAHGDHRIAMAMCVAALRATDIVTVEDVESVNKSFPDFFNVLSSIHVQLNCTSN